MRRIQRTSKTMTRRWLRRNSNTTTLQEWNPNDEENDEIGHTHQNNDNGIPNLPGAIWVTHVMPYLDRVGQNRLCATCRDIYITAKQFRVEMPWPDGSFRFHRPVLAHAFSPDSKVLAVVIANAKTILLWKRSRGMDQTLKGHEGIVSDVKFDTTTGVLASCSRTDGTILLWNKQDATDDQPDPPYVCINKLVLRVYAMRFIRFSPAGDMIAVWGNDRVIRVEKMNNPGTKQDHIGSVPWRSRLGIKCCDSVVFANRGEEERLLVYTFNNEQVRLWNYDTQSVRELRDQERTIREGDYDSYITCVSTVSIQGQDGNPARQYLVVGCRVAMLKLWNLDDYSCVRSFHLGSGWSGVTNITFTSDGRYLACTSEGSSIRVFDVENSARVAVYTEHKGRVESLSFTSDGQFLVSGSVDRTVTFRSMTNMLTPPPS